MEIIPLKVDCVSKSFPPTNPARWLPWRSTQVDVAPVVKEISFELKRGEVYGIIGANGSGKSTLVRIVSTLLLPDCGDVSIFGLDAIKEPAKVRTFINRVSADPSFFRNMSTLENLLFFGRIYGMNRQQIYDAAPVILKRLSFEWEKAKEPMSHLSRGQQQKVAIARSFLTAPVLMLLDEPTTGLDPRSKRDVQAFVRDVRREHDATILLTTHDMEEAESLCDRVAFLSRGRVVAEGTPLELRKLVANDRQLESVTMDTVFMELTGQDLGEDEAAPERSA